MELRVHIETFKTILIELKKKFELNNENIINNTQEEEDLYAPDFNTDTDTNINITEDKLYNSSLLYAYANEKLPFEDIISISRKHLSNFEIKKEEKDFYNIYLSFCDTIRENIDHRLKILVRIKNIDLLDETNNYLYVNFHTKQEFFDFFSILLNAEDSKYMSNKRILQFLKEMFILLRDKSGDINNINSIINELHLRLLLLFQNLKLRNFKEEDFELHKAVYEGNLRAIRKILANETNSHLYCEINECDVNGNTPLILAIKMNNYDAVNVLCDHEAEIKHKCYDSDISALELAVVRKDKKLLQILLSAQRKQKVASWETYKTRVLNVIKAIPDFSIELKLNFDSNIFSLFSALAPSNYYKITKMGGNVRVDMNISPMFSKFNPIKGKSSILVRENGKDLNIYKIEHEKKHVRKFLM
jgi:ankyrin repeat protein